MKGNDLKPHVGIFGRRNYGKSSLVNYLTGQNISIVSDVPGTTTDPVKKTMEIMGIGPIVWVDTAGIDDEGVVGRQRISKSLEMLERVDLALILFTNNKFDAEEVSLVEGCRSKNIPYVLIYSQVDKFNPDMELINQIQHDFETRVFLLSVRNPGLREPLLDAVRKSIPESAYRRKSLLGDVLTAGDVVVLVTPIDASAPEGRLILPQVQVIRDIIDNNAKAVVCRESELQSALLDLKQPPRLVITDSQIYPLVSQQVPDDVFLTSFSVVLARNKGLFVDYVKGTPKISNLNDGDTVLLLESCTHNVTCDDIGRVKIPNMISKFTQKNLNFEVVSGLDSLDKPISEYALVIQCGGCVVTAKQIASRLAPALSEGVPVSNYGLAIAYVSGIFERSMRIFDQISIY